MRILAAVALAALSFAASAQEMQPGKYRTTLTSDIPAMKGRPMTDEDCFTAKEIADGLTKVGIEKESECKVSDFKRSPGRVSYRLACTEDGNKTSGSADGTFTSDSFDFRIVMAGPQTGGKPVATRITGKRVGACN